MLPLAFWRLGTKAGLVGGAVYMSVNSGVWSKDTTQNAVAVKNFTETVESRLGVDYVAKVRRAVIAYLFCSYQ